MKKFILYIFIIFLINLNCTYECYSANSAQTAEISKIENDFYGFDYTNDELKKRVARLEKTIYGKESTGDLTARIKKLANDICAEQIGLEIPPCEDTFLENETTADNTVSYPVVDEIEKKLFGTTYPDRDFHTRIVTIERKLFGKIYDVDDYSTRMDRIKTAAMPEALLKDNNRFKYDDNALSSNDLSGLNSDRYSPMPYGQRNFTRPYANYGEYGGSFSPSQTRTTDEELAQLEYDTFGTEFSGDDTRTRLKRLNSVNKAKKSSRKYDSQKFQQHMSTAMEIGAMILMILAMVL
jgi:hypothetical protein